MKFTGAILAVGYFTAVIAGPMCYECQNVDNRRKCNKVKKCADDELCFTDKHLRNGKLMYSMACKKQSICADQPGTIAWTKEKLEEVVVATGEDMSLCRECCSGDMCNDNTCDQISQNIVCDDHTLCKHAADDGLLECNHTEIYQYCMESCGGCHKAGFIKRPTAGDGIPKMAAFQAVHDDDDDNLESESSELQICGLFVTFYDGLSGKKRKTPTQNPFFTLVKGWATASHDSQKKRKNRNGFWRKGGGKLWKNGGLGRGNGLSKKISGLGSGLWGIKKLGSMWTASSEEDSDETITAQREKHAEMKTQGKFNSVFKTIVDSVIQHIALSDPDEVAILASSFSQSVAEGVQELAVTLEIWLDSQYCGEWMSIICPSTCYYDHRS